MNYWLVKFKVKKPGCCGSPYWVAHSQIVKAQDQTQAQQIVCESWSPRSELEVQSIEQFQGGV